MKIGSGSAFTGEKVMMNGTVVCGMRSHSGTGKILNGFRLSDDRDPILNIFKGVKLSLHSRSLDPVKLPNNFPLHLSPQASTNTITMG